MTVQTIQTDVFIVGASAAGLMCAIEAGKRGRRVWVIDHANKPGKKILMSGGGRCNFTNYEVSAANYISHNPHFCKSALKRFSQWDFLAMVNEYQIPFHERSHGQLFCDRSAKDILNMLLAECAKYKVTIKLNDTLSSVSANETGLFHCRATDTIFETASLVIATGGLSIPKMCASPFGYRIAEQFGHHIQPTCAGLVPFTLHSEDKIRLAVLSGIAVDSLVHNQRARFRENILFTHRGLSGPAILQISSYWRPGETITINLCPDLELETLLKTEQQQHPNQKLKNVLGRYLPKRLIEVLLEHKVCEQPLQACSHVQLQLIAQQFQHWQLKPNGTEGYRTAEVTLGGVDCDELSSKTMESKLQRGLYFVGEVIDVSGWLGGYNFQWAWSSGWCAGQVV